MIGWITLSAAIVFVLALATFVVLRWKRPPKLKQDHFKTKWQELQKLLRNKDRWDVALIEADNLFNLALKKSRMRGKSQGERMVKAQRKFTDNDGAWFAHKLRKQVESEPEFKLKEKDIKDALIAIRQALKDLGALK